MLYYDRIDISEGTELAKTNNSKECIQQTFVVLEDVFKTSSRHVLQTSSKRLLGKSVSKKP